MIDTMGKSVFCFAPPGDDPYTKRIFDILLSGCIPVVFTYSAGGGSSWWYSGGPLVSESFPFAEELDWGRLVVEVPHDLREDLCTAVEARCDAR